MSEKPMSYTLTQEASSSSLRQFLSEGRITSITDEIDPSRNFCGIAVLGTIINHFSKEPIITPSLELGKVSVAELVELLDTFNGHRESEESQPWRTFDPDGTVWHQGICTVLEGFGLSSRSVKDFSRVEEFQAFLDPTNPQGSGILALSVDNRFINSITSPLQNIPSRDLKPGTHLIAVLGYEKGSDMYIVFDPAGKTCMVLPARGINEYLHRGDNKTKAIVVGRSKTALDQIASFAKASIHIPESVVQATSQLRRQIITSPE